MNVYFKTCLIIGFYFILIQFQPAHCKNSREGNGGFCSSFDTSVSFASWSNRQDGTDKWKWSGYVKPFLQNVPTFNAESDYIWVENLSNSTSIERTAIFKTYSEDIIIDNDDNVTMSIFRHIIDDDGSFRPKLRFVSDYGAHSKDILWSYNQDDWDIVQITCGQNAEPCCLFYPCIGYFEIVGETMANGEFIAIDFVSINQSIICGY